MATYIAEADSYAGFGSTGKNFGYFGLVAGAVGLTGWAAMHGHLPGLQPADAGSQLMLTAMEWIGGGVFGLMAVAVLGSLMLSSKSPMFLSARCMAARRLEFSLARDSAQARKSDTKTYSRISARNVVLP